MYTLHTLDQQVQKNNQVCSQYLAKQQFNVKSSMLNIWYTPNQYCETFYNMIKLAGNLSIEQYCLQFFT